MISDLRVNRELLEAYDFISGFGQRLGKQDWKMNSIEAEIYSYILSIDRSIMTFNSEFSRQLEDENGSNEHSAMINIRKGTSWKASQSMLP
jgi:hypothetical protein